MKKINFIFLFNISLTLLACAHLANASQSSEGFAANGSLLWGVGSFQNNSGTIQSRTMNTLALNVMPGYRWNNFLFGPMGEFRIVGQMTEPSTVSNTNVKGSGYLIGLGVGYSWNEFDMTAGYDFFGQHSQSNTDALGNAIVNKSPSGIVVQVGYRFMPDISADLRFDMVSYGTDTVGGVDNNVSTNKSKHMNFSLGATYHL